MSCFSQEISEGTSGFQVSLFSNVFSFHVHNYCFVAHQENTDLNLCLLGCHHQHPPFIFL